MSEDNKPPIVVTGETRDYQAAALAVLAASIGPKIIIPLHLGKSAAAEQAVMRPDLLDKCREDIVSYLGARIGDNMPSASAESIKDAYEESVRRADTRFMNTKLRMESETVPLHLCKEGDRVWISFSRGYGSVGEVYIRKIKYIAGGKVQIKYVKVWRFQDGQNKVLKIDIPQDYKVKRYFEASKPSEQIIDSASS